MPLAVEKIKAICFDVDGTLRDTDDQWMRSLSRLLQPMRILFPERDPLPFARWLVMASEDPGTMLLGWLDSWGLDATLDRLSGKLYRQRTPTFSDEALIPGVDRLLARLSVHYPLAIISARNDRVTNAFLDRFGLTRYFSVLATAQTCRYTKPYPDQLFWVAKELGVSPEACLMVGDTTVDILAGKAAGAQTIGVLCGFGRESELRQRGADLILSNTLDLEGILLRSE
jgi:phosphoglycolate phosphatase-like HAD superfamily hydrolase